MGSARVTWGTEILADMRCMVLMSLIPHRPLIVISSGASGEHPLCMRKFAECVLKWGGIPATGKTLEGFSSVGEGGEESDWGLEAGVQAIDSSVYDASKFSKEVFVGLVSSRGWERVLGLIRGRDDSARGKQKWSSKRELTL